MRFSLLFTFHFLLLTSLFALPDTYYQIEQQNDEHIIIQFNFPDLEVTTSNPSDPLAFIDIPGLPYHQIEGKPLLPILSLSLAVPEGKVDWRIISSDIKVIENKRPVIYLSDPEDQQVPVVGYTDNLYPNQIVQLEDAGIFRDYRILGIIIFPVQVTSSGMKFYKNMKLEIQFQKTLDTAVNRLSPLENKLFDKFVINSQSLSLISPVVNQPLQSFGKGIINTDYSRQIKIYLDKKGIYQITGQDLLDNDIVIQDINPQTFRLTNKGKDVAIYIYGDQDLNFDASDYIEFLGEPNEKTFLDTYPDLYTDPFSDENVYWLSWGETPGIRMVEESGAIITKNPTQYNPALFYPCTLHFEKNLSFERFNYGNTQKLSYTRDLWFFDFGIQAISKKNYAVNLIFPDSSSFNPVTVQMMLAGKSQTSHSVMVWLNQRLVGQTVNDWYGQNIFLLDNSSNSTIRTIDLKHGVNNLEIQLPAFAEGGKSDWVLFNWADITYDRQYRAHQNYIEFTRPSPSVIYYPDKTLFQFEITDFTRRDIEIYKKGISKIVNYNINVQDEGSRTRYKITFQDNIYTDDVEYIALASDAKMKPTHIEKDNPYDQDNPFLSLREPSNSADYLIITHQRFYERAKELLDSRRSSGLNAVMVKVQDIYDEFNFGIKSPLAIKRFLEYVFYNWDRSHRLKYVLLFGDANYNYKLTGTPNEDYVPTFFYQTLEFGAVASDLPYALIAGDDHLPDIYVGRIPVTTNGEVTNVINKIMEYEENLVRDPWLNQMLFISGNDRSTTEFAGVPYVPKTPAFRTQNQRIIDMILDKKYTTFKLNTIKDDTLQFDPNFGGTTDLIDYFDNGLQFVNFFGHGGGGIWADVQLLNLQDVERLNNKGKYPFITSMTCFTGAFENPGNPGLAQKLLLVPDKGAIGIFASSGLGWLANDYSMLWNVMKHLSEPDISVGEAITLGKIDYFINSQYVVSDTIVPGNQWGHRTLKYDMVYQYNLVGDPYIHIHSPQSDINIQVDNDSPQPGDTIEVQLEAPLVLAEGYLELANGKNEVVYREPLFYTGNQTTLNLKIPENFKRGSAYVRAYLSDNVLDASGVKQIGVNSTVFEEVQTLPAQPNAEDSVLIRLVARDNAGITQVRVVAVMPVGIVPNDTIHLSTHQIAPNTFETIKKIPPTLSLTTVHYFVYTKNSQDQQSRMNYSYKVEETRPDPLIYGGKIRFLGEEKVKLGVTVGNSGEIPAQNIELKVYNGKENFQNDLPFAQQLITVDGKDSITSKFDFPFPLDVSLYNIYASLDRQQEAPDFNRTNNEDSISLNVRMYNLTPELGSTYQNIYNDTISVKSKSQFWLGPSSISNPSAVSLEFKPFPDELKQRELIPIPAVNSSRPEIFEIIRYNQLAQLSSPFFLRIVFNKSYMTSNNLKYSMLNLYRWNTQYSVWLQQEATVDSISGVLTANMQKDGIYMPFVSGDNTPPRIELTIDGRQVRTEMLVSPHPVLNIIVEDESGLNLNREQIGIKLNEFDVPPEKIFIPDSVQQSNVLGITVYPELDLGKHQLNIEVKDVNGNVSQKAYTLQVDDEFDLHVYGNYPNPFSDVTIFSYYITGQEILDDLEIRIFTTSGRLVKRIKNDINTSTPGNDPKRVGYNELMWDGTDEDGNPVANGVYFALFRVKLEDKVKEEIIKVAKLR